MSDRHQPALESHAAHPAGMARPQSDVVGPGHSFGSITDKITSIVLTHRTPLWWYGGSAVVASLTGVLFVSLSYLVVEGIGIWGNNQRSAGRSTSPTSSGGSASDTPGR